MLSDEQTAEIKKQLIERVASIFPEDKQEFAISQIESMSPEELEDFLQKNDIAMQQNQKCIFCSITSEEIPSYKIGENTTSLAVLELNPLSKGHALIIPKKHLSSKDKIPKTLTTLAESISKKINSKLNPRRIETSPAELMGHYVLNIVPIYEDETPSERTKASEEELKSLQEELLKKAAPKKKAAKPKTEMPGGGGGARGGKQKQTPKKEEKPEKLWLPKRIP